VLHCGVPASFNRTIGSRWGEAEALKFLGLALQDGQRRDEAQVCWQEALRIFTELRAPDADDVRALLTSALGLPVN
jgi:hypothetical protein